MGIFFRKSNEVIDNNEHDELLNKAIDIVIQTGQASTSFIQRRFGIGYAEAARIIDQMEGKGVISTYQGAKTRDVLIDMEEWNRIKNKNNIVKDELLEKINNINYIIKTMDDNNIGYENFSKKYSEIEDNENSTKDMFRFSIFVFIGYIVNGNLLASDYNIIKKYIGTEFGSTNIANENVFNQVFGTTFKEGKFEPLDWYCFYMQNDELLKKGLLDDENRNIIKLLVEVYEGIGKKIARNSNDYEQRKKRCNQYIDYCNEKINELIGQTEQLEETINTNKMSNIENEKIENNETLEELIGQLNNLVGLENVKNDVNSLINLIKVRKIREEKNIRQSAMSLHLVFSGNPGTGKTTVARLIAKIYYKMGILSKGNFVEVDRSELVGGYVGQTALKVKEVCNKAIGGLLFIDEAYTLNSNKDSADFGKEAIETLLKFMEDNRDDFIVVVAGYTDLMEEFLNSNPGLKSRFNKYIFFNDYNPEELLEIYINLCKDSQLKLSKEAEIHVKEFFEYRYNNRTQNFANARDVRNFFEKTLINQANRIVGDNIITDNELTQIELEDVMDIELRL